LLLTSAKFFSTFIHVVSKREKRVLKLQIKDNNKDDFTKKEVKDLELDERKKRVLEAVIEEYTKTAEPVGSLKIASSLGCSSATVRNEMADLEELGY